MGFIHRAYVKSHSICWMHVTSLDSVEFTESLEPRTGLSACGFRSTRLIQISQQIFNSFRYSSASQHLNKSANLIAVSMVRTPNAIECVCHKCVFVCVCEGAGVVRTCSQYSHGFDAHTNIHKTHGVYVCEYLEYPRLTKGPLRTARTTGRVSSSQHIFVCVSMWQQVESHLLSYGTSAAALSRQCECTS